MNRMARGGYLSLLFVIHLACIIGAVALVAPLEEPEAPVQADRGTSTASSSRSAGVVDLPMQAGGEVRAPDAVAGTQGGGNFSEEKDEPGAQMPAEPAINSVDVAPSRTIREGRERGATAQANQSMLGDDG